MNGNLDFRSIPDLMAPGSWRFRQNFACPEPNKLCRRTGWEKLLTRAPYNNQDLHDQLLVLQQYWPDLVPPASDSGSVTPLPSGSCGTPIATRLQGREYITLLFEATSTTGTRKLIAGTQSRVYELNESTGNWRILGDGFGGATKSDLSRRFHAAQVKDSVLFTNNYDKVQAYQLFSPPVGCAYRAMHPIADLDTIALSAAACIYAYKNVMFLGNVVMDGQTIQNRLVWSDFNDPESWDPARANITGTIGSTLTGNVLSWSNPNGLSYMVQSRLNSSQNWVEFKITSGTSVTVLNTALQYRVVSFTVSTVAGYQDLSYGHKILAINQIGDYLTVLTDKGIWQGTPTGNSGQDGPAFSFRLTYDASLSGDKCVCYPNTVCSTGGSLFWLGRDAAYLYNYFESEPQKVEWIHKATGAIYNGFAGFQGINDQCCESHVAEYRPAQKEVWVSWATIGSCIPSQTMVINVEEKCIDTVDAGWTAFVNHRSDLRPTLREFLINFCICTNQQLAQDGITYLKEGLPLSSVTPSCDIIPTVIYTHETIPVDPAVPEGQQMEDYDAAEAAADSLCAAFGDLTLADLCLDCNQDQLFIGALSEDLCLKQIGTSYNRELCTNPTSREGSVIFVDANGIVTYQSSTGIYVLEGYYSVMRTAPMDFGLEALRKNLKRVLVSFISDVQVDPCVIQVRIGVAYNNVDPNAGYNADPNNSQNASSGCGFVWRAVLRKLMDCPQDLSPEQYVEQNLVPNLGMEWATYETGRYFCFEIVIANLVQQEDIDGQLAPALGGSGCFSRIEFWVQPQTK